MDYADIATNPEAHGFRWSMETVSKGDRELGKAPLMVVTDLAKFDATFQNVIMSALDGSSLRVQCQGKGRAILAQHLNIKPEDFKTMMVARISGAKARTVRTTTVFVGPEDTTWNTREEAAQAWKDFYLDPHPAEEPDAFEDIQETGDDIE